MRKLLVLTGLAGAAAVAAKRLWGRRAEPVWHTPDTDADQPPLHAVPDPARPADDAAGAGLDEALADSVEEPHLSTTPDAPLQEEDVPRD